MNQIMTAQNDITMNYIGKILLNPDPILSGEARQQGIKIFEDMLYEARVFSEMQKRKLAVIGKEWEIEPASDNAQDMKVADFVKKVFENFSYDTARQALLSGIVTGFKPGEIMWDYSEGDIWIKSINGGSPKRFVFDLQSNLRLLTWGNMIEGEEIPDRKFIVFRNPSDINSPYGDGIGRALYWPIWFKKNGVKFWAVFLDKFGQPTPWGKYPQGTDKPTQTKLLDSLKAMQTDQCLITPDNMKVQLLEAARTSSVDSYDRWEKFWNDAITFIILGQAATTEGTPGMLGAQTERAEVRQEIIKADADLLCECQNDQLIKWLVDYNFPGIKEYPKVWIRTEPEQDLKPLAERDQILVKNIGLPTAKSYFYDTYGIPEPQPDEELVTPPATPSPLGFAEMKDIRHQTSDVRLQSKASGLGFKVWGLRSGVIFTEQDWVSWYIDQISPSLKNIKGEALTKIETYLRSQSSPPSEEEFTSAIQGILGDAYKNIDQVAIADAVTGIYQAVKGIEAAVGFGGADIRAINFLSTLDHFYLSKFIDNPDAQAALIDFLKTRYLEGGSRSLWHRKP